MRPGRRVLGFVAFAPGGRAQRVRVPRNTGEARFAGRRVAYFARKLVVADWRTGEMERRYTFDPDDPYDLRADGTLAFIRDDRLFTARPGAPPQPLRRVSGTLYGSMSWAGDEIAVIREQNVAVVDPDGRLRRISPRYDFVEDVVADDQHVMWEADDRVWAAPVG